MEFLCWMSQRVDGFLQAETGNDMSPESQN